MSLIRSHRLLAPLRSKRICVCMPEEQFEAYSQENQIGSNAWYDQPIDPIGLLRPPVEPSKAQSGVLYVTLLLWLLGHGQLNHQDPVHKHSGSPLTTNWNPHWSRGCLTALHRFSRYVLRPQPTNVCPLYINK